MNQQQNPYAATQVTLNEQRPLESLELAGRGTRLGAVLIDMLCIGGLGMVAAILVPAMSKGGGGAGALIASLLFIAGILALVIYNLVLIHRQGQTIGKRTLGIKVVRTDGSHCDLGRYIFLRILVTSLIGAIPFVGGIINLIGILLIFRDSRKCLHDEIAGTIVVKA